MAETYRNYIEDCLEELVERLDEAQMNKEGGDFELGRAFAYLEVLSFLVNQAEVFQIKGDFKDKLEKLKKYDLL